MEVEFVYVINQCCDVLYIVIIPCLPQSARLVVNKKRRTTSA